ncbi:hypothetical protein Q604_UNBC14008G0001, partial [human gut metagenome]
LTPLKAGDNTLKYQLRYKSTKAGATGGNATAASMTENGHRRDMHPAEQIAGFRAMAQEGKTPAQIGDL